MTGNAYDRRRSRREIDRQRRLMGESLQAFHRRETAPPPTLAEIFARNRADTAVCPRTQDLFAERPKRRGRGQRCKA